MKTPLLLSAILTISACANVDVIHPAAKTLPASQTAKFIVDYEAESRATPVIIRVRDPQGSDVVSFDGLYKNSVVLPPGQYEVHLSCTLGNNFSATPKVRINAIAGHLYYLHCRLDGAMASARVRDVPLVTQ